MIDDADDSADREQRIEAEAIAAAKRMTQHFDDWLCIARGFDLGRTQCLRESGAHDTHAQAYKKHFAQWLDKEPDARGFVRSTRSHLFWLAAHESEVAEWRSTLSEAQRRSMSHPSSVKRAFDTATKPPKPHETESRAKILESELAETQDQLFAMRAKTEMDGLFDWRYDPVDQIAKSLVRILNADRLSALIAALIAERDLFDRAA